MGKHEECNHGIYCKYCGAKLKFDPYGHYCGTRNCQWEHGVKGCLIYSEVTTDEH